MLGELKDGTLIEQFSAFLEENKKKSDIIAFLEEIGEQYQRYGENVPFEKAEEAIEFADYFYENFYDVMQIEIMMKWGDDPYILRLATALEYQMYSEERKNYIQSLLPAMRKEAETLADTLFSIRLERCFTFVYVEDENIINGVFRLPRVIRKRDLEDAKEELLFICCKLIQNKGVVITRITQKDHDEIFGIRVLPIGVWSPLTSEEVRSASLITANGIELEPEEGVVYTEIQRRRF